MIRCYRWWRYVPWYWCRTQYILFRWTGCHRDWGPPYDETSNKDFVKHVRAVQKSLAHFKMGDYITAEEFLNDLRYAETKIHESKLN
jgi:hypothetical protein